MKVGEIYDEREAERAEAFEEGYKQAVKDIEEKMYQKSFIDDNDMQRWDGGLWVRYKLFEQTIEEVSE